MTSQVELRLAKRESASSWKIVAAVALQYEHARMTSHDITISGECVPHHDHERQVCFHRAKRGMLRTCVDAFHVAHMASALLRPWPCSSRKLVQHGMRRKIPPVMCSPVSAWPWASHWDIRCALLPARRTGRSAGTPSQRNHSSIIGAMLQLVCERWCATVLSMTHLA